MGERLLTCAAVPTPGGALGELILTCTACVSLEGPWES
jgi:hypothetical protein